MEVGGWVGRLRWVKQNVPRARFFPPLLLLLLLAAWAPMLLAGTVASSFSSIPFQSLLCSDGRRGVGGWVGLTGRFGCRAPLATHPTTTMQCGDTLRACTPRVDTGVRGDVGLEKVRCSR